jgi:TetR/AcrR family transcriptional repressor of nem operon
MSDSKEHIIKVACKHFLQKSFKEVTMKELVKSTGLSKGAFYHYFESKEQLFNEVLDFFFTNVMIHAYENYSRESFYLFYHDYAKEVEVYCKTYLDMFKDDEDESILTMNYFSLAFDAIKLFPGFKEKMIEGMRIELDTWKDVIHDARKKGEIKSSMTDEEIAQTFIYLGDGVGMHMIIRGAKLEAMIAPFLTLWDKLYDQIKA